MREQITFESVRTQEQFDALKDYVAVNDHVHRFDDHSILPAVTMRRGAKRIGYFQVLNQPIVMPSFHVNSCTPRDFVEASEQLKSIFQFNSMSDRFPNGTLFLGLPPQLMVDDALVGKLGGERIQRELWQFTPKGESKQ